jgi:adenylate cyclase
MFEVVAVFEAREIWRRPLADGEEKKIGSIGKGDARVAPQFRSDWVVADGALSGWHVTVRRKGNTLEVQRRTLPKPTTNAVLFHGAANDEFEMAAGDEFTIQNAGYQFKWAADDEAATQSAHERPSEGTDDPLEFEPEADEPPVVHTSFRLQRRELENVSFGQGRILPDALDRLARLGQSHASAAQAYQQIAEILVTGLPDAVAAAVIHRAQKNQEPQILALFPAQLKNQRFYTTQILDDALDSRFESIGLDFKEPEDHYRDVSMRIGVDWAVCTPLPDSEEKLALYIVGRSANDGGVARVHRKKIGLQQAMKFADLAASILGVVLKKQRLEIEKARLRTFPPKALLPLLRLEKPDYDRLTAPRVCSVTVLFCDLRGFSLFAEHHADDLMFSARTVRKAVNAITNIIVSHDGVIGDLQGDAAMAFWGWPDAMPDQIERAVKAALGIAQSFSQNADLKTTEFSCGVGLAHGEAAVGLMGVAHQEKIDVFGPVVNRASRLESLTKRFGVQVLVDDGVRTGLANAGNERKVAFRALPRVRLAGMKQPQQVHELFDPNEAARPRPNLTIWNAALDSFFHGNWAAARDQIDRSFRQLSKEDREEDLVARILTDYMDKHTTPGSEVVLDLEK